MTKELLEKLKGQKTKIKLLGKDFNVKITDIIEDEYQEEEYLDGSYTKDELIELANSLSETSKQYKVYGELSSSDVKKLDILQKISKDNYYKQFSGGVSGCPFIEQDYHNPLLLQIFKDGEEPNY